MPSDSVIASKRILYNHGLPIALVLLTLVIALAGPDYNQLLRYEYRAISDGEIWRVITGQLAHLSDTHLLLNLMSLALIWGLFWRTYTPLGWLGLFFMSALATGCGLYFINPEIGWYVGLSGLLHGMFIGGAIGQIRQGNYREGILLAVVVIKLIWEQFYGAMPGSADMAGGEVIVESHLYGAIGGLLAMLFIKPKNWC